MNKKECINKTIFITLLIFFLILAFIQCYKSAHDLLWTVEEDFDRDMSFVQSTLDGDFGKDPSYRNEYLWYNPLLFLIETGLVKATHHPVNVILARAGVYLNLFTPIAFALMVYFLFNIEIALSATAAFLFFTSGNLLGWGSATYSPWLYPVNFMQFIFYLNIILCYKVFSSQKYCWFLLLGVFLGISFLGHTAPTLLIILIMISIQSANIFKSIKEKNYALTKKNILQGLLTFAFFILFSIPLLFFIVGKYQLHMVNRITFELSQGYFNWFNFHHLFLANISTSFFIAIYGFIIFILRNKNLLLRKIIFNWLFISSFLFLYCSSLTAIRIKFHISLPGFVPSFHFFFYLKALQSVFFGIGLFNIFKQVIEYLYNFFFRAHPYHLKENSVNNGFYILILIISVAYYPIYAQRSDFILPREEAIKKQNDVDKIEVYHWIVKNIPPHDVILCNKELSLFPILATGRKMVSTNPTFSNPYIDFAERESDRMKMLYYLKYNRPDSAKYLFNKYEANILLINNDSIPYYSHLNGHYNSRIFQNKTYSLFTR